MPTPNGIVLYEGPSMLDLAPIVVIATGFANGSKNEKTGNMIQTWIMRSDLPPTFAVKCGLDASICGNCPHRGDGTGKARSCYVAVHQAPLNVWKAYKRGTYDRSAVSTLRPNPDVIEWGEGQIIRLGSYGDPLAVPWPVWRLFLERAVGRTGYTHQWREPRAWSYAEWLMASCDSEADYHEARAAGWRTFRVVKPEGEKLDGEMWCPAETRGLTCVECRRCRGSNTRLHNVAIHVHGSKPRVNAFINR